MWCDSCYSITFHINSQGCSRTFPNLLVCLWVNPKLPEGRTHVLYLFMEKAMAPHSSTLAWKIPWMEEPGGLQSLGSLWVGYDWATSLSLFTFMHWRRKCQPTPVFWPGESQGRWSLVGCRLWGHTESDTTERLNWLNWRWSLSCYTVQEVLLTSILGWFATPSSSGSGFVRALHYNLSVLGSPTRHGS